MTLCAPARAISSAPITVMSASTSAIGCELRAAVTANESNTTGFGGGLCCASATGAAAASEQRRRACAMRSALARKRIGGSMRRQGGCAARGNQTWRSPRSAARPRAAMPGAPCDCGLRHGDARHVAGPEAPMATPPRPGRRPVSGLASLDRPPSRRRASFEASRQWRVGRPALAYRCGGSCGLARIESARHRIPVSPAARDSRRTPAWPDSTAVARARSRAARHLSTGRAAPRDPPAIILALSMTSAPTG